MNRISYVLRSLFHYRWLSLAVLAAVAVATVVLSGALFVGDSVQSSLRAMVLDRLGAIDVLLLSERFFDPGMADGIRTSSPELLVRTACILPQATVEAQLNHPRARGVFVSAWPDQQLVGEIGPDEIVINQPLAADLQVSIGDRLVIRLPEVNEVPADSPLGRKDGRVRSRAGLIVKQIIPPQGAGNLSLAINQQTPRNAFVALATLQQTLGVGQRVNAIAVSSPSRLLSEAEAESLTKLLTPTLDDFGISLTRIEATHTADGQRQVAWACFQLTCDRMIWDEPVRAAVMAALHSERPREVLTYLANSISKLPPPDDGQESWEAASPQLEICSIPYSTVAALDAAGMALLSGMDGTPLPPIRDDEIVLNSWAAQDLNATIGDRIELRYFAPETTHGQAIETTREFRLASIVPITAPDRPYLRRRSAVFLEPPTRANDPWLTPSVAGITDQASIDDWDPPFPFDQSRVRPVDDDYWAQYRTTPKAFVTLSAGRQMWASRFGRVTNIRIECSDRQPSDADLPSLRNTVERTLQRRHADLGFAFQPVKQLSLQAATGTTSFAGLFLGFSFFLMAAALMLIGILVRLGWQMRAPEVGLLQAVGWRYRAAAKLLVSESAVIATAGAIVGSLAGLGFAALLLWALRTWWVRAITVPFVKLHASRTSMCIGLTSGVLLALAVAVWTVRGLSRMPITALLRGKIGTRTSTRKSHRRALGWSSFLLLAAVVMGAVATGQSGMTQAGLFFGSGAMLLAGLLTIVRYQLLAATAAHEFALASRLSVQNLATYAFSGLRRQPTRSTLTVGLVSTACFLIIAISAFQLQPTDSGTGGFRWIARSDRPLFMDLNDPEVQQIEFGTDLEGRDVRFAPLRVQAGDDASCRNLFRVARPRILGVTPAFVAACRQQPTSFAWASVPDRDGGPTPTDAWDELTATATGNNVPVILDLNTALYSLHLKGRLGEEFSLEDAAPVQFEIVGLLSNTILQGSLMIGESRFEKLFPEVSGYSMMLVHMPDTNSATVKSALEQRFSDEGLDLSDAKSELDDLLAIQNTYLSTFQSLGALGLLLGTIGLAIVQLRNVLERRGEMALLHGLGFPPSRVARIVMYETAWLLLLGFCVGTVSACLAIAPHLVRGDAALPLFALGMMLLSIAVCGLLSSALAVRAALRVPILATLRSERL